MILCYLVVVDGTPMMHLNKTLELNEVKCTYCIAAWILKNEVVNDRKQIFTMSLLRHSIGA